MASSSSLSCLRKTCGYGSCLPAELANATDMDQLCLQSTISGAIWNERVGLFTSWQFSIKRLGGKNGAVLFGRTLLIQGVFEKMLEANRRTSRPFFCCRLFRGNPWSQGHHVGMRAPRLCSKRPQPLREWSLCPLARSELTRKCFWWTIFSGHLSSWKTSSPRLGMPRAAWSHDWQSNRDRIPVNHHHDIPRTKKLQKT